MPFSPLPTLRPRLPLVNNSAMYITFVDQTTRVVYEIRGPEGMIGRDTAGAIAFTGDQANTVSVRHARVLNADGQWWVEDVGSRNGTFVDEQRLDPGARRALVKGRVMRFGSRGPKLEVTAAESPVQAT